MAAELYFRSEETGEEEPVYVAMADAKLWSPVSSPVPQSPKPAWKEEAPPDGDAFSAISGFGLPVHTRASRSRSPDERGLEKGYLGVGPPSQRCGQCGRSLSDRYSAVVSFGVTEDKETVPETTLDLLYVCDTCVQLAAGSNGTNIGCDSPTNDNGTDAGSDISEVTRDANVRGGHGNDANKAGSTPAEATAADNNQTESTSTTACVQLLVGMNGALSPCDLSQTQPGTGTSYLSHAEAEKTPSEMNSNNYKTDDSINNSKSDSDKELIVTSVSANDGQSAVQVISEEGGEGNQSQEVCRVEVKTVRQELPVVSEQHSSTELSLNLSGVVSSGDNSLHPAGQNGVSSPGSHDVSLASAQSDKRPKGLNTLSSELSPPHDSPSQSGQQQKPHHQGQPQTGLAVMHRLFPHHHQSKSAANAGVPQGNRSDVPEPKGTHIELQSFAKRSSASKSKKTKPVKDEPVLMTYRRRADIPVPVCNLQSGSVNALQSPVKEDHPQKTLHAGRDQSSGVSSNTTAGVSSHLTSSQSLTVAGVNSHPASSQSLSVAGVSSHPASSQSLSVAGVSSHPYSSQSLTVAGVRSQPASSQSLSVAAVATRDSDDLHLQHCASVVGNVNQPELESKTASVTEIVPLRAGKSRERREEDAKAVSASGWAGADPKQGLVGIQARSETAQESQGSTARSVSRRSDDASLTGVQVEIEVVRGGGKLQLSKKMMAKLQSPRTQCCLCASSVFSVLFGVLMLSVGVCLVLNYNFLEVDTSGLPPNLHNDEGKKVVGIILICVGIAAMLLGGLVSGLYFSACDPAPRPTPVAPTPGSRDGRGSGPAQGRPSSHEGPRHPRNGGGAGPHHHHHHHHHQHLNGVGGRLSPMMNKLPATTGGVAALPSPLLSAGEPSYARGVNGGVAASGGGARAKVPRHGKGKSRHQTGRYKHTLPSHQEEEGAEAQSLNESRHSAASRKRLHFPDRQGHDNLAAVLGDDEAALGSRGSSAASSLTPSVIIRVESHSGSEEEERPQTYPGTCPPPPPGWRDTNLSGPMVTGLGSETFAGTPLGEGEEVGDDRDSDRTSSATQDSQDATPSEAGSDPRTFDEQVRDLVS